MTTRKSSSRSTSDRTATARRPASVRRSPASRRRSGRATPRRRRRSTASTIGAALGMLLVTLFLRMSWGLRIGLVALVLVLGAVWVLWSHRQEIAAATADTPETADAAGTTDPTDPNDPTKEQTS